MSTESISVICENETDAEQHETQDPYMTSGQIMTDVNCTKWMLDTVVAKKADGTSIYLREVLRTHRWRQGMLLVANNKEVDRRREAEAQVRAWAMQTHGASASISLSLRAGQRMANLLREFVKHIPAAQAALDDWNIQVWGKKQ